jgi:hypothetical protein
MVAHPLDESRRLGCISRGISNRVILQAPAVTEVTVLVPDSIVVYFKSICTFIKRAAEVEIFCKNGSIYNGEKNAQYQ